MSAFDMNGETTLYPVTSKLARDEWEKLRREKVEPWALMEVGDGLHVTNFYGQAIHYRGVLYPGSPRLVFWSRYIDPFLEDIVLRLLDRTVALCKEEGHEPRAALQEAGRLLKQLVRTACREMVSIDERLGAGSGPPPSQSAEKVISDLDAFIDARVSGLVAVLEVPRTQLQRWKHRVEQNRVAAAVMLVLGGATVIATFTDTASRLVTAVRQWLHR